MILWKQIKLLLRVWSLHWLYLEVVLSWLFLSLCRIHSGRNIMLIISTHRRLLIKVLQKVQVILIYQNLLMRINNLLNLRCLLVNAKLSSRDNYLFIILGGIAFYSRSRSTAISCLRSKEAISCYFALILNVVFLGLRRASLLGKLFVNWLNLLLIINKASGT